MTPRWRRAGFLAAEATLLVMVPVLAYQGFTAVLDTTDGRVVDPELDPDQPGYEAFVESTPTLAVLGRDDEGRLSWTAVLALSGSDDHGGSVILVPASTLAPEFAVDWDTLAEIDAAGGAAATAQSLADILGAAIGDTVDVSPTRLAELVAPVGPLVIRNPDPVGEFGSGELSIAASDLGRFLLAAGQGESDLTRLTRHEEFWRSWLGAVTASTNPDAVPGETSSGIGRFIRGLAAGPVSVDVPPVTAEDTAAGTVEFRVDPVGAYDLAEDRIPFPASPRPGARPRVRVLDGVGADDLALRTARDVVNAGGQIVVIGNADRFDATTSRVVYFEDSVASRARTIAEALGLEAERLDGPNPDDGVDVTVVAGNDLLSAYGLSARITTGDGSG